MKFILPKNSSLSIFFLFVFIVNLFPSPVSAASPTPTSVPIAGITTSSPPFGWSLAGFLVLVFLYMIYQSTKSFIFRKFFPKKIKKYRLS